MKLNFVLTLLSENDKNDKKCVRTWSYIGSQRNFIQENRAARATNFIFNFVDNFQLKLLPRRAWFEKRIYG